MSWPHQMLPDFVRSHFPAPLVFRKANGSHQLKQSKEWGGAKDKQLIAVRQLSPIQASELHPRHNVRSTTSY